VFFAGLVACRYTPVTRIFDISNNDLSGMGAVLRTDACIYFAGSYSLPCCTARLSSVLHYPLFLLLLLTPQLLLLTHWLVLPPPWLLQAPSPPG
jgi:hypothetical protein